MPGDSVWLCSTHPKPSPTTFRGWHRSDRGGAIRPKSCSKPRRGAARNRRRTVAWSARKAAGRRGPGARSPRAGPKSKKIGVRHGVLGPWAPGVRNLGNVPSTQAGPVLSPVLKTDKKSISFNIGGTYVEPYVEKIKHQRQRLQCRRDQH